MRDARPGSRKRPTYAGTSGPPARTAYATGAGDLLQVRIEDFLRSDAAEKVRGKVQLVLTSPPFPLNHKKAYGNLTGEDYLEWISSLAEPLSKLLRPKGSLVIELCNSWEPGTPTMSTLALEAFLAFKRAGNLKLCQQFVIHNPARLPSPAQWVTIERIRVKDSFTTAWWLAKTDRPFASNRNVLIPYSPAMKKLLGGATYSAGRRPSEHTIGSDSFRTNNGGAIPGNVLQYSNTASSDDYLAYCRRRKLTPHPARMPARMAEFFIRMLTRRGDLVFDPFAGSNTVGAVAESLGRRWLGTELEPTYIRSSAGRFNPVPKVSVGRVRADTPGASRPQRRGQ